MTYEQVNQAPMGAQPPSAPSAQPQYQAPPPAQQYPQYAAQYPQYAAQYPQYQQVVMTKREWRQGLYSCTEDCGTCCDVFWCSPCVQARAWDAVVDKQPDSMNPLACLAFYCGAQCCVPNIGAWYMHDKISKEQGLVDADGCANIFAAVCCVPCMTCQLVNESRARGIDPGYCCCAPSVAIGQQQQQQQQQQQHQAPVQQNAAVPTQGGYSPPPDAPVKPTAPLLA
eukprot:TRINITY_DN627_c1_g1_i1.p1 TRINITY_DN627_c1_g1~~TRINITY_DN627_c1_g1_i1.p1  ORF type:complete len:226 (+),score=71.82 TRINITY_DN627_c1_g1_i1:67-744(+)